MFPAKLLLVYVLVPAILYVAAVATPVPTRFLILFLGFPAALILFTAVDNLRSRAGRGEGEERE